MEDGPPQPHTELLVGLQFGETVNLQSLDIFLTVNKSSEKTQEERVRPRYKQMRTQFGETVNLQSLDIVVTVNKSSEKTQKERIHSHYKLMRTHFVERVSNELIKQLLDDLLADGVLNAEERDSVLESRNTRAEKARHLFDMVKKGGDGAMEKMVFHLQHRDPKLYQSMQNWIQLHYELMRTQFVAKVSNEVIDQLLDDLLADGFLNAKEKNSVLENRTTADKACCLFDMVNRKQDGTMERMVFHLKDRDPVLYQILQNWIQPHYELMRTHFVERVSNDMIKQLLDDLLADGFVNDGEKDWVLEANSSTADKARCLFDMVNRKRDGAMEKMVFHLKDRDPKLYQILQKWAQGN